MTDEVSYETRSDYVAVVSIRVSDLETKLRFVETASNKFAERVAVLEQQYAELLKRLIALEGEAPTLYGFGAQAEAAKDVKFRPAPFGSIDKLVEQIERMFDCKDGDHRACHTVYTEKGEVQYPYTTVGLIAPADIPDAQERLRQAMYTAFHKLKLTCKSERPVLYWRYAKQERVQEDAVNDSDSVPVKYKIMTRIAVPEADFSVIENVVKLDTTGYAVLVQ